MGRRAALGKMRQIDRLEGWPKIGNKTLRRDSDHQRDSLKSEQGETIMVQLKTSEALLQALSVAAKRKQTPEQAHRQRVSFIMGALGQKSGVTKEKVERVLAQEGKGQE